MASAPFTLIAHDLKNALGSLEGELENLVDAPSTENAKSAYAHCVDLRRQLIQFLTVYGSGDALRAHCEDESPQEMLELVQNIGEARYLSQPSAPQVLIQHGAATPAYWFFDQHLVQMALDAALHNASRFAREKITLSVTEAQTYLIFAIDDDGPGLDAPQEAQSGRSTGLGTKLCQAVAQAHRSGERQGRVELLNRPDGGTRFELWLP